MPAAATIVKRLKPVGTGSQSYSDRGFDPACVLTFDAGSLVDSYEDCTVHLAATLPTVGGGINYSNGNGRAQPTGVSAIEPDSHLYGGSTTTRRAKQTGVSGLGEVLNWTIVTAGTELASLALGGPGLVAAVGNFLLPTSGTVTVTGLAFQPTVLLLMHELRNTFGGTSSSGMVGLGWSDGTNHRAIANRSPLALSAIEKMIFRNDAITTTTNAWRSPLDSFTADGFALTPAVYPATTILHTYLALAGVGTPKVGTFTQPTSTGVQSVSTGNSPTCVILFGGSATTANTESSNVDYMLGAITQNEQAGAWAGAQDGAGTSITAARWTMGAALLKSAYNRSSITNQASGALTGSGFDLNWTAVDGTARLFAYVALEVPDYALVSVPGGGNRWWWRRGY